MNPSLIDQANHLVREAIKLGALDADAWVTYECGESIQVRNGEIEGIQREEAFGFSVRVFVRTSNQLASAAASCSHATRDELTSLAEKAMAMARLAAPDEEIVPPSGSIHPSEETLAQWEKVHTPPRRVWTRDAAIQAAKACEQAAFDYSGKISNSEGAQASFSRTAHAYASADGFAAMYENASASLSLAVVAGSGDAMQRDYAWDLACCATRLRQADEIGREAAERACKRLGASSIQSQVMPVIFEPRTAVSLLGHLASAANAKAVLQGRSFLAEARQKQIMPSFVDVLDDPIHPEGLLDRPFDGEGMQTSALRLVEKGTLTTFFNDRATARRLAIPANAHARRSLSGVLEIGANNLCLAPGESSPEAIYRDMSRALIVTELMGFGINPVTGDYSRGAVGYLIENGRITAPVQGVTIAGNLKEMFMNITHLGNDLTWFGTRAAPTIAIAKMTVAGERS